LRQLEHLNRQLPTSRALKRPLVQLALLEETSPDEVLQSNGAVQITSNQSDDAATELQQIAQAYETGIGEYIVFVRLGDQLDREFVERHIYLRQHGPLVAVSCSDVRLASQQGSLVSADVFRNSGAWKQPLQQVPPLATGLRDWVAPPMSACLFRRTAFLDRLFARRASLPPALQSAGFWLVFQLAHHTGGALRILETLGTCRLPDGAAASYGYLSAPAGSDATLIDAPVLEAATWLERFYREEQVLFRQWLPDAWHQRFVPWLTAQKKAGTKASLG